MSTSTESYSIPKEAERVLHEGILQNPLISKYIHSDVKSDAHLVSFVGSSAPSLPINWRFAESISALKAYEALLVNALIKRKYGEQAPRMVINTYVEAADVTIYLVRG